jgi:8-oxo-dGTP pyrophosphatase MutT (NUDIX family)
MAASSHPTTQYTSSQFVESCGTILFRLSTKQVCLIHHLSKNEWLLPKGRRNCAESGQQAALREAREETGYPCSLHPVTMLTRAPHENEAGDVPDLPREYADLTEPLMVTIRKLEGGEGVKLIFWYVAVVDDRGREDREPAFNAEFLGYGEGVSRLTFEGDREVLRAAIAIVERQEA